MVFHPVKHRFGEDLQLVRIFVVYCSRLVVGSGVIEDEGDICNELGDTTITNAFLSNEPALRVSLSILNLFLDCFEVHWLLYNIQVAFDLLGVNRLFKGPRVVVTKEEAKDLAALFLEGALICQLLLLVLFGRPSCFAQASDLVKTFVIITTLKL